MNRFSAADLDALADLLCQAGRAEVMPRFRRLPEEAVRTKSGPMDIVTDADEAAEAFIAAGLRARFPAALVIGEEAASADPDLLGALKGAPIAFVVDPIDGTANYAAGMPLFGMMAAVVIDGQVAAAAVHDPVLEETSLALAGGGAWCIAPGQPRRMLRVSQPAPVHEMSGSFAWRFLPEPRRGRALAGAAAVGGAWDFRCAAHQYRLLINAKLHFSMYSRLLPWDHAPGWLLHREAGGYSARFDGSAYDPTDPTGGLICAPDRACWEQLHHVLL